MVDNFYSGDFWFVSLCVYSCGKSICDCRTLGNISSLLSNLHCLRHTHTHSVEVKITVWHNICLCTCYAIQRTRQIGTYIAKNRIDRFSPMMGYYVFNLKISSKAKWIVSCGVEYLKLHHWSALSSFIYFSFSISFSSFSSSWFRLAKTTFCHTVIGKL